jgi:NAD(P)-dependent dehydrogenase (short-subunit alcohol dehydrogenase family)
MIERFTRGTPEGRARVIAQEPIGRMGKPEEIAATARSARAGASSRRVTRFQ